ncbi:MAG: SDR family NAD(P)-dependent oxidoreductase [Chloroflexia bacterium]
MLLAHRGWVVVAGVRRGEDGEALRAAAGAIGAGALLRPIALDVTDGASVARAVGEVGAEVERRGVRLVGLVNNAGIAVAGPVEEVPLARGAGAGGERDRGGGDDAGAVAAVARGGGGS